VTDFLLTVRQVNQLYGNSHILWDVDLEAERGRCTCVMGRNGVGKTTLLKSVMGLLPIRSGEIYLGAESLGRLSADACARAGIGYVPQGRDIFATLTVEENLRLATAVKGKLRDVMPGKLFELFPVLGEMLSRRGGDLSGGQEQQLTIARALVLQPQLLILDEPTEGIQPNVVAHLGDVIRRLNMVSTQ
jgi:urea transport system ATP-binding protein